MVSLLILVLIGLVAWALRRVSRLEREVRDLQDSLARLRRPRSADAPPTSEPQATQAQAPAAEPQQPETAPLPASTPPSPPEAPAPVPARVPLVQVPYKPPAPPPVAPPAVEDPPPPAPIAAPPVAPPVEPGGISQLEATVGGKWSLWVGLVLILCAAAFGIAYGWAYIGPAGRVGCGVVLGLVLLGLSEWFRPRTEKWYGEGLAAGGVSLLYLSIWGAAMSYDLIGIPPAFAAMALVTGLGVALALRQDALSLIVLSTIGGFLTPALLQGSGTGQSDATLFWLYVTVLNIGVVGAANLRLWRPVWLVALVGSIMLIGGWLDAQYDDSMRWTSLGFLCANLVVFLIAATVDSIRSGARPGSVELWILFGATTAFFIAAIHVLPDSPSPARGLLALGLAAVQLCLGLEARRRSPQDSLLPSATFAMGGALVVIAGPLLVGGSALAMIWAAEAVALTYVGLRSARELVATAGWLVLTMALAVLISADPGRGHVQDILLLNPRGATFLVLIGACCSMTWLWLRLGESDALAQGSAGVLLTGAGLLSLWLAASEVADLFEVRQWGGMALVSSAWLAILSLWALVGRGCHAVGERLNLTGPRTLGLCVLLLVPVAFALVGGSTLGEDWLPVLNLRLLGGLVVILCCVSLARVWRPSVAEPASAQADALAVMGALLAVALGSEEIQAAFPDAASADPGSRMAAVWLSTTTLWALGALVCVTVGVRWRSMALRWAGASLWLTAALVTLVCAFAEGTYAWAPYLNLRVLAFVALALSLVGIWRSARDAPEALTDDELAVFGTNAVVAIGALLGVIELAIETWSIFRWSQYPSPDMWRNAGHLGVSVVWTLYAAVWLTAGVSRRHALSRWFGLGLFGLTLLKVFVWDLQFLSLPYRMVSFGVLGVILVAVALLYAQFGRRLLEDWASETPAPQDDIGDR